MIEGTVARWIGGVAAHAEVPVFLARGLGAGGADALLRASTSLRLTDSPRAATVLVVAGQVPTKSAEPLARVHDQMAHPRATVWWTGSGAAPTPEGWPQATMIGPDEDLIAAVAVAHRALLTGARPSDPPLLSDVDPAPWRGVGPYGQGGKGMTGGVPYGRPMAGRGADRRDGLTLDIVPLRVGPFFPLLPPGLVLSVTFAGDIVHDVTVAGSLSPDAVGLGTPVAEDTVDAGLATADWPAPVAEIERSRARHHLGGLARLLHLYGLDALARRVAAQAVSVPDDPSDLLALSRRLDRPWALGRAPRGVGIIAGTDAAAWGGSIARAAGVAVDARSHSPSYTKLGFTPVVHQAGDNRDRWKQRLAEAIQSVELASRAGRATVAPGEPIEPREPPPPADAAERLTGLLLGAEWGDALAILASIEPAVPAIAGVGGAAT